MLRATWKLKFFVIGSLGLLHGTASAEDPPPAGKDIGNQATGAIQTLSNLFKGGEVGAEAAGGLYRMDRSLDGGGELGAGTRRDCGRGKSLWRSSRWELFC